MGKKTPAPPPAPDPVKTVQAQQAANTATAQEQQRLNMVGSRDQTGTVSWEADPTQPGGYTQVTTLSPGQQSLYDRGNDLQNSALGTAGTALGNVNSALGLGLTAPTLDGDWRQSYQQGADAYYNAGAGRLNDQFGRSEQQLRTDLSNQGLNENDEAYQNALRDFSYGRNDAYNQLNAGAYTTGANMGLAGANFANQSADSNFKNQAYAGNNSINQFSTLLNGGQVSSPTGFGYTPTQVAGADVLGAQQQALNQQNVGYQAKVGNQQAMMGGLFKLGSSFLGANNFFQAKG
jgi:hypothetical protein